MEGRAYLRPFEDPFAVGGKAVCTDAAVASCSASQRSQRCSGVLRGIYCAVRTRPWWGLNGRPQNPFRFSLPQTALGPQSPAASKSIPRCRLKTRQRLKILRLEHIVDYLAGSGHRKSRPCSVTAAYIGPPSIGQFCETHGKGLALMFELQVAVHLFYPSPSASAIQFTDQTPCFSSKQRLLTRGQCTVCGFLTPVLEGKLPNGGNVRRLSAG